MIAELDTTRFKAEVLDERRTVLVDFHATWCEPCKMQDPIIEKLAARLGPAAKVVKVDVERSPELADLFAIRTIPTIVMFRDGKIIRRFTGLTAGPTLAAALVAQPG